MNFCFSYNQETFFFKSFKLIITKALQKLMVIIKLWAREFYNGNSDRYSEHCKARQNSATQKLNGKRNSGHWRDKDDNGQANRQGARWQRI